MVLLGRLPADHEKRKVRSRGPLHGDAFVSARREATFASRQTARPSSRPRTWDRNVTHRATRMSRSATPLRLRRCPQGFCERRRFGSFTPRTDHTPPRSASGANWDCPGHVRGVRGPWLGRLSTSTEPARPRSRGAGDRRDPPWSGAPKRPADPARGGPLGVAGRRPLRCDRVVGRGARRRIRGRWPESGRASWIPAVCLWSESA